MAMRPFAVMGEPATLSHRVAALYNSRAMQSRQQVSDAVHSMYSPDAWFIDPLVAVEGAEDIVEQFWSLRLLFGGDGAASVPVRYLSQDAVTRRGSVTSTATPGMLEPIVSADCDGAGASGSPVAGSPLASGSHGLASDTAGHADTPGEALRVETVATFPLPVLGAVLGCSVRLR